MISEKGVLKQVIFKDSMSSCLSCSVKWHSLNQCPTVLNPFSHSQSRSNHSLQV